MDEALPQNTEQVEKLVLALYQPNPPNVIARIQHVLSRLQTTPQAWALAHELVERSGSEQVKFFGVLTIIVKLNTQSSSLDDKDAGELLGQLLRWYADFTPQGPTKLVRRKLASALATFHLHFHRLWPQYIRHIICAIASSTSHGSLELSQAHNAQAYLDGMDKQQLQAALWAATAIVEDATKVDLNAPSNIGIFHRVFESMPDAVSLMRTSLPVLYKDSAFYEDAIKCLQDYTWFAQRASTRDLTFVEMLRPLVTVAIDLLTQDGYRNAALEYLTEVLSNYSGFLNEEQYEKLLSIMSDKDFSHLIGANSSVDDDQEGIVVRFVLAFGDARMMELMQSSDGRARRILGNIVEFFNNGGYPGVDDNIFVPAVEFWQTFAETMTDFTFSDESASDTEWFERALSQLLMAVSAAWQRTIFPPSEEIDEWDSDYRVGFSEARSDMVDLLQSTYVLAGPPLVFTFAGVITSALAEGSWLRLEASTYCLGGLAECAKEDLRCEDALRSVFQSDLFSQLRSDQGEIPAQTRKTCLSLIEKFTEYFERNLAMLPAAVTLLFQIVSEPAMSTAASKSIAKLCSSCRSHLHGEAHGFLSEYQRVSDGQMLDCASSERVLGGIASVVQAIPDLSQRHRSVQSLLEFVEKDVGAITQSNAGFAVQSLPCAHAGCYDETLDEDGVLHVGLRALRSLASIAKGLRAPSESSIDLEHDQRHSTISDPVLASLQQRIWQIVRGVEYCAGAKAGVYEAIGSVLRSGFAEAEPGPFVLSPAEVAQYLIEHSSPHPRICVFVGVASSLVSSLDAKSVEQHQEMLRSLLAWVTHLLSVCDETDPELSQNAFDFGSRCASKSPYAMPLNDSVTEKFFEFALHTLKGKEPLPKAASATLWATFISLKSTDPSWEDAMRSTMDRMGPFLGEALAYNFSGAASRSEIDRLCDPLRKLAVRYPKTREWLEAGLRNQGGASQKITDAEKSMFVKKVISLRGARGTNQVVRDFWLAARGSSFMYAS